MGKRTKGGYYAVKQGRKPGIYQTWAEAEVQVKGFPGAIHTKFSSNEQALRYLNQAVAAPPPPPSIASTSSHKRARDEGEDDRGRDAKRGIKNEMGGFENERIVYCDGSSLGNGQRGASAGIGVYWNSRSTPDLSERLPGRLQTNNRGEMYAIARILETDRHPWKPLTIATDSEYCIGCFQTWIRGWQTYGWVSRNGDPVKNQDLIRYVMSMIALRGEGKVRFTKVLAHSGISGNEMADILAKEGAGKAPVRERDYEGDREKNEMLLQYRLEEHQSSSSGVGASRVKVPRSLTSKEKIHQQIAMDEAMIQIEESDLLTHDELMRMELLQTFD